MSFHDSFPLMKCLWLQLSISFYYFLHYISVFCPYVHCSGAVLCFCHWWSV